MAIPCWSCSAPREPTDALCPSCHRVQPPPAVRPGERALFDKFAFLGLPRSHRLDEQALEEALRTLSRKLHPDRFARASAQERRFALEQSTRLNDAVKTLRDPVRRAEHLLELRGVMVADDGPRRPGEPAPRKLELPPEFLEQAMEDRERLLDAKLEGDPRALAALAGAARQRRDEALTAVQGFLDSPEPDLAAAALELARLRYTSRYLDEVEGRGTEL